MKRTIVAVLAAGVLSAAGSALAAQNLRIGVGGGVLIPMSDYKDVDKMGWVAGADATYWLMGAPVGIRIEGDYSQTSHKDQLGVAIGGNTKIIGGMADVVYAFGTSALQLRPYILGGVGLYNVKVKASAGGITVDTSETKVGFGGGAGLALKIGTGSTRVFVEGKFVSVSTSGTSTTFLPIKAGIRFGN